MPVDLSLTMGYVVRHAPSKGAGGYEAALIDIAQDLLLRELHTRGITEHLAFKGGTALRKLYAGGEGRFSTDLDFALRTPEEDPCVVLDMLVEAVRDLSVGPYRFGVQERRGKPHVTIDSSLGSVDTLRCKLDVNPPPWLATERRGWVPLPIHERYGGPLPELHVVRLEENLAEKIARLNRVTPARDAYDLVWILEHRRGLTRPLDLDLVRHLAVMKTWVDMHGLECSQHVWKRVHEPRPFDIGRWLRPRTQREFDDETIGLLTSPPPSLGALGDALVREFGFLRNLTLEETALARCRGGDRALLLHALDKLPDTQMAVGTCW